MSDCPCLLCGIGSRKGLDVISSGGSGAEGALETEHVTTQQA